MRKFTFLGLAALVGVCTFALNGRMRKERVHADRSPALARVERTRSSLSPKIESFAVARSVDRETAPPEAAPPTREDETLRDQLALAELDRIRAIPGAAALVDDIVEFIQNDKYNEFSLENIPTDENGLAVIDENTTAQMIRNEAIREKWTRLMRLMAENKVSKGS